MSRLTTHTSCAYLYAAGVASADVKLQAGDIVWVKAYQNNDEDAAVQLSGGYFDGHLIFEE